MSIDPLNIAASALDAYETASSITANNIANVATPGYESEAAIFESVLGAQIGGGVTIGGGVQIGAIEVNTQSGGLMPTGNPTDFAVNGNGLFVLQSPQGPVYSRAGNFTLNANGQLVDAATGFPVLGYSANGTLAPIAVPTGAAAQATATSAATIGGNLDQSVYQAAASGSPASPITVNGTIYDSLGNAHVVNYTFTPVPVSAGGVNPATQTVNNAQGVPNNVGTEWQVSVTNANPSDPMTVAPNTSYVFFSPTGQYINTSTDPTGQTNTGLGNTFSVPGWGPGDAATPATITTNYTTMSSLAGASDATITSQSGSGSGSLQTISVSSTGAISGVFSNGTQQPIGQVALANFSNAAGLVHLGSNLLAASPASGSAQLGTAGSGNYGTLVPGMLESSNVSLDDEFIKLIESQSAFDANAKTVIISQKDLDTLMNMG